MDTILILGGLPKTEEDILLYESIINIAKDYAENVLSPIDTAKTNLGPHERYERALQIVKSADLVIGEQSKPSTGQGIEIRECDLFDKPLIVIAKEGSKVSGLVEGCPITKEIIYYNTIKDLESKLRNSISQI